MSKLSDLVSAFGTPLSRPPLSVSRDYCDASEIQTAPEPAEFYVEPELTILSGSAAPVLLVSAPGAVGKTALAGFLHRKLAEQGRQVLYVPLRKSTIGQNFVSGLLSRAFPSASLDECLNRLAEGSLVLILDGFDEVSISREQLDLNILLVREVAMLAERLPPGRRGHAFVILFRSVFFEYGIFDSVEFISKHVQISFFGHAKQQEFLRQYLVHRNTETDEDARRLFAKEASDILSSFQTRLSVAGTAAAGFFGHAIVLSALAEYLLASYAQMAREAGSENPYAFLQQQLSADITDGDSSRLLESIVQKVLEREVNKFPDDRFTGQLPEFRGYSAELQSSLLMEFAASLAEERSTAAQLLGIRQTIEEQVDAILSKHTAFNQLPPGTQEDIRQKYYDEVASKLEQHPFLEPRVSLGFGFRNPIYLDYFLAQFLARRPDSPPAPVVDGVFGPNGIKPSVYLAMFYLAALPGRDLARRGPMLHYVTKLLAQAVSIDEVDITAEWRPDKKHWEVQFSGGVVNVDPFYFCDPLLSLEVPDDAIVQNVSITAFVTDSWGADELANDAWVCIGPNDATKEATSRLLLDRVFIAAEQVEICCARLKLSTVELHAKEFTLGSLVQDVQGASTLEICGNHDASIDMPSFVDHRWGAEIRSSLKQSGRDDLFKAKLKKILTHFRRHGREDYAVYSKKYENYCLSKRADQLAVVLDEVLRSRGIISERKDESIVVLDQEKLAHFGIRYAKQNEISFDSDNWRPLFDEWDSMARERDLV